MIRLLALREVMQNVTAEQASILACGNSAYIEMFKLLPYVLPKHDWRELVQAQLLSGIKPRHMNSRREVPLSKSSIYRIRTYPRLPEAECILDSNATLENYLPIAQQFYRNVLKPIQLNGYVEIQDNYMLWYYIRSLSRTSVLPLIYIKDVEVTAMLKRMQSQTSSYVGYFFQRYGRSSEIARSIGKVSQNARNYKLVDDSNSIMLAEEYSKELEKVYELLYNVRTHGIINDGLMEAKYEDFF